MSTKNLSHQHVAILGGGRSGLAAAALAAREGAREGARVTIFDTQDDAAAGKLRQACAGMPGVALVTGTAAQAEASAVTTFDILITSPGISLVDGWGAGMAARARLVMGEIEFAAGYFTGRTIGITGTNGKTTTTEMVRELLLAAGFKACAAGNYGMPLAEVVLAHPEIELVALELSSFQLETIIHYRPDVAVWLNFAPDHMDRYRSLEEYRAAKARLFLNIRPGDTIVVPPEEARLAAPSGARVRTFAVDDPRADWHVANGWIVRDGQPVLALREIAVRGRHNQANLLAAWAAAHALGVPDAAAQVVFARYLPPPHRYELVARHDGVDFINDSKSTNIHSLQTALEAEDRPLVLIAGGKEKGLDYAPLAPLVARRCRAVIGIGEIRPHLRAVWAGGVAYHEAGSLAEAVQLAASLAAAGDAVLLSPGTSSFDMFRDYTHRGEEFRRLAGTMPATPLSTNP